MNREYSKLDKLSLILIMPLIIFVLTYYGCSSETTGSPEISCVIVVTSPTSSSNWTVNQSRVITWISSGDCGSEVMIELYKGSLRTCNIESATDNDGSYNWAVSYCGGSGSDYRIKITDLSNGASDFSSYFQYYQL